MLEVELKILEINRMFVEKTLSSLGAQKVFDGEIHSIYYDNSGKDIKKTQGTLRLRRKGDQTLLTFKQYVDNKEAKVRREHEVEISDFHAVRSIIEAIGFSVWLDIKKHRTSYAYNGLHFEMDKYHGRFEHVPEFLEVEGPDIGSVRKGISLLGFTEQQCRPWDTMQVIKHYSDQNR
ncbi:MAG: class IV adenylate cyclase [Nitrospiraceae bacterium]|nr:MAG: class IV adenylate cyclase [Nitrospiraceae bacterium]